MAGALRKERRLWRVLYETKAEQAPANLPVALADALSIRSIPNTTEAIPT